ncbi:hypothetical protein ABE057_15765 [Bacillus paralicheniformis]|uniref:hypothetical protein n=1 Tax=Bacillus TaxID=1386 RepID=UPI001FB9CAAB|nr:hypothetical protein [Bacillus sp. B19-2]MCJ2145798.1 hypothetical protein [Bacillus sp. B19-2]
MKKILFLILFSIMMAFSFHIQPADAAVTKDEKKTTMTMTEDQVGFFMADSTNVNYYPTWLYYKFTIFNAEGCTLNIKLQRITLTGHAITLSEKEFTGNHLHLSAADKVSGTPHRNHFLDITKVSGCGDVGITGFYGFEHQVPDYSS